MSEADDPNQPTEGSPQPPSEEELRARIEQQLRTVRVQDLLLESVVSVLNLAARRIAKEDERDLEQGLMDAPWPPVYPKQPHEPPRVAPSRAKAD